MKKFNYIKFYNSDTTTQEYWDKLSKPQKKKLQRLFDKLEKDLISFKLNEDIAYSMLMHLLTHKIELVEEAVTVNHTVPKQLSSNDKW